MGRKDSVRSLRRGEALKSTAEAKAEEATHAAKDRLVALKMEKQPVVDQKVAGQQMQSSSEEAVTEVETSAVEADEMVRKFVVNRDEAWLSAARCIQRDRCPFSSKEELARSTLVVKALGSSGVS